ncbi:MAG: DUF1559 domain-containing protein, partial [Phycisphaerales bacterium]|nr:DUF1559 domain-containing protein [Phycisphaerales bacterium]
IAIIALLIGILLPALGHARAAARRAACLSNAKQLATASSMYAADHRTEMFIPTFHPADDNIGWLHPGYISQPEAALCPSTKHTIDPNEMLSETFPEFSETFGKDFLRDLVFNGRDRTDEEGGHSYEVFAWFSPGKFLDGTVIWGLDWGPTGRQLGWSRRDDAAGLYDNTTEYVLKTMKSVVRPDKTILYLDSDQDDSPFPGIGNPDGINNWPEAWNNHGEAGLNIGFTDAHASWIKREDLIRTYLESFEEPPENFEDVSNYRESQYTHRGQRIPWYVEVD